jgi:septal ring-binding cell division protein DamX
VLLIGLALGYLAQYLYRSQFIKSSSAASGVKETANESKTVTAIDVSPPIVQITPTIAQAPMSVQTPANNIEQNLSTATPATTTATAVNPPDMLQTRLQATQQWITVLPKDTVTIQILGSSVETQLRSQLTMLAQTIELDKIFVYQTMVNQQIFYTVVYVNYADRFSANQALKQLPESLQKNRPQLRTIGGILEETKKST